MRAEHCHTGSKVALEIRFPASSIMFLFYRNLVESSKSTGNLKYTARSSNPTTGLLGLENEKYSLLGTMI